MRRMYSLNQLQEIALKKIESTTSLKVFENIVDKDGHKRFVEGEVNLEENTGFTKTYGKWALSGSHLLIVLALDLENGTTTLKSTISTINLPNWIKDKIYKLYGTSTIINYTANLYGDDYSSQTSSVALNKTGDNKIQIYFQITTATADRHCRIAFDLLIDNE